MNSGVVVFAGNTLVVNGGSLNAGFTVNGTANLMSGSITVQMKKPSTDQPPFSRSRVEPTRSPTCPVIPAVSSSIVEPSTTSTAAPPPPTMSTLAAWETPPGRERSISPQVVPWPFQFTHRRIHWHNQPQYRRFLLDRQPPEQRPDQPEWRNIQCLRHHLRHRQHRPNRRHHQRRRWHSNQQQHLHRQRLHHIHLPRQRQL